MKRSLILVIGIVLTMVIFTGCGKVRQGEEGILIHNLGTGKGAIKLVGPGRHWYNPITHDLETNPLQLQNVSWQTNKDNTGAFSWNDSKGLTFQTDVGISYRVAPGASAEIYRTFKKGLEEVTNIEMKNRLQDAFNRAGSKRKTEEIYGAGKTEFMDEVKALLAAEFEGLFIIEKVSLKGRMVLPRMVQEGIERKQAAIQKAEQRSNEVAEAKAEREKAKEVSDAKAYQVERDARAKATALEAQAKAEATAIELQAKAEAVAIKLKAQAKAKAIKQINSALTPLYNEYVINSNWDGKLPQYTTDIPLMKLVE
jgi:regulator of protease activity HflC (stomatin/prohibitin superfamily)